MDDKKKEKKSEGEKNPEVELLKSIESLINLNLSKIDRIKEEIKPVRDMIKGFLDNDESYMELSEVAKKASSDKGARKSELMMTANGQELKGKENAMKEELREAEESLSAHLAEYQRITGSNEFEADDGELRQIVYTAKLVRKTNLNK